MCACFTYCTDYDNSIGPRPLRPIHETPNSQCHLSLAKIYKYNIQTLEGKINTAKYNFYQQLEQLTCCLSDEHLPHHSPVNEVHNITAHR